MSKTTTYKVTSVIYEGYAMYVDEWLTQLYGEKKPTQIIVLPVGDSIPLSEFELLHSELWTAKEIKGKTVAEKVALFSMMYQKHKGFAYRANKVEKANMKQVMVNEKLLNTYFTATQYPLAGNKSMADYVKHYNEVRDLSANGAPARGEFPAVYDHEYEKKISGDPSKLQRYWASLRERGWQKVDGIWLEKR